LPALLRSQRDCCAPTEKLRATAPVMGSAEQQAIARALPEDSGLRSRKYTEGEMQEKMEACSSSGAIRESGNSFSEGWKDYCTLLNPADRARRLGGRGHFRSYSSAGSAPRMYAGNCRK